MQIADTPRLLINHFTENDAAFVLRILNSPGWIRFIGDRNVRTVEAAAEYTRERFMAGYTTLGFGMYAVRLKETGELIGMCGLVKRDQFEQVDIGYAFLPEYGGRGYAVEAAAAVLRYANETLLLNPVLAIVTPDNSASIRLLEKLRFILQGTITQNNEELLLFKNDVGDAR